MTAINNFSSLNLKIPLTEEQIASNKKIDDKQDMKQEDFFSLLSQQLAYQDPFKPVGNSEMVAQMASFTTAEGITKMGAKFSGMSDILTSSQALEASSLVGKKVLTKSNDAYLGKTDGVSSAIETKNGASNVMVNIEDENGAVIRTLTVGDLAPGRKRIEWDGLDSQGERAKEGKYKLQAAGLVNGKGGNLKTESYAHIESVSLGGGQAGVSLNLQGLGGIKLSDANEIAENI